MPKPIFLLQRSNVRRPNVGQLLGSVLAPPLNAPASMVRFLLGPT